MMIKTLFGAAAIATTAAFTAAATPIELDFAFDGVSGTFFGLDDAISGSQSTTSYDFHGVLGDYTGVPIDVNLGSNDFRFIGGTLSLVEFSEPSTPRSDALNPSSFLFRFGLTVNGGSSSELVSRTNSVSNSGIPTFTIRNVAAVPLPAGVGLLLSALAGLAGLGWLKTHRNEQQRQA